MMALRTFLQNRSGATAAEFALVLPIALLLFFGIIDVGRYVWAINELEKSVQAGARYAVATDIVPDGLNSADYVGDTSCGTTLTAGDTICKEALGTISCSSASGTVSCTCETSPCPTLGTANTTAFTNIVSRMNVIDARIRASNVTIKYSGSGLGYAGDPATDDDGNDLSDIAPIVTVEVPSVPFRALLLLGGGVDLPRVSYSLTLEDGVGAMAY